jgi:hypothetical protein
MTTENDVDDDREALRQYRLVADGLRAVRDYERTRYTLALRHGERPAHVKFRADEAYLSQQIQQIETFIPLIEARIAHLEASTK